MITYTPRTALEAAVLKSERFELATDTAGREVVCAGFERLPQVVLPRDAEGLQGLVGAVAVGEATAFAVTAGDPWQIEPEAVRASTTVVAAEEYLVMGLRPLKLEGKPLRVVSGGSVVRLFLLPWTMPATTLNFGYEPHFLVTSTRSVVGDWVSVPDGRRGVVVGLSEAWVGVLERQARPGSSITFRCDVPVPWVGDDGLSNATPTTAAAYEVAGSPPLDGGVGAGAAVQPWLAKLPVAMAEGNVVRPVLVPGDLEAEEVHDGPWETEWHGANDFSMSGLN